MSDKNLKKEVWLNSYPIFLWLVSEPLVGIIDSKIASYLNLEVLSAVGVGSAVNNLDDLISMIAVVRGLKESLKNSMIKEKIS